jgi:hypothetical protein
MAVNVSATFKKDEREYNGLEGIRDDLIGKPLERRTIVATIEVTAITTNVRDGGVQTPTVRLVSVEALSGDDALTARKLLDAAYHERTGQTAPPPSLFDDGQDPDAPPNDPTPSAERWPGDDGEAAPDDADDAAQDEVAAKRGRKR